MTWGPHGGLAWGGARGLTCYPPMVRAPGSVCAAASFLAVRAARVGPGFHLWLVWERRALAHLRPGAAVTKDWSLPLCPAPVGPGCALVTVTPCWAGAASQGPRQVRGGGGSQWPSESPHPLLTALGSATSPFWDRLCCRPVPQPSGPPRRCVSLWLSLSSFSTPLFCHCLQTSAALSALCPLPPGRVCPSLCPGPAAWSLRLGPGPTEAGGVEGGRAGRRASGRLGGADCTALVLECLPFLALLAAALQPRLASCLPLAGQPQVSVPAGRPWSLLHRDPSRGQAGSLTVTHCALITLLMRQAPPLLFGSWLRPMVEEGQAGGRPAQAWPPVGKPQRDSTLQARAVLPLPLPLPQQNPVCGLSGVSPGASVQHGSSRRRSGRPGWVLQNRPRARPLRLPKGSFALRQQDCWKEAGMPCGALWDIAPWAPCLWVAWA